MESEGRKVVIREVEQVIDRLRADADGARGVADGNSEVLETSENLDRAAAMLSDLPKIEAACRSKVVGEVRESLAQLITEDESCECEPGDGGIGTIRCTFHRFADRLLASLDSYAEQPQDQEVRSDDADQGPVGRSGDAAAVHGAQRPGEPGTEGGPGAGADPSPARSRTRSAELDPACPYTEQPEQEKGCDGTGKITFIKGLAEDAKFKVVDCPGCSRCRLASALRTVEQQQRRADSEQERGNRLEEELEKAVEALQWIKCDAADCASSEPKAIVETVHSISLTTLRDLGRDEAPRKQPEQEDCERCGGEGWLSSGETGGDHLPRCPDCNGTGKKQPGQPEEENSGQNWMQTSLALQHFESEMRSAGELANASAPGSADRTRYETEASTYRYILKQIRSAHPEQPKGEEGCDGSGLISVRGGAVPGAGSVGPPESAPCSGCTKCTLPPSVLTVDEASAVVAAAFAEDHDSRVFDAVIKRLGDWVDADLGLAASQPDTGVRSPAPTEEECP